MFLGPRFKTAVALAAAVLISAPAVEAGPPHCPPGHAKKGWCGHGKGARSYDRGYERGYRDGRRDAYRVGDRVRRERYVVIEDYYDYGYRRPPVGHVYARIGGDVFLIALATGLIIEALR